MTRSLPALAAVFLCAALPCDLLAQKKGPDYPQSRLETIFPVGAKAGTSVEVNLTGTELDGMKSLKFGHPGIKAEVVVVPPPPVDPKKPAPVKKDGPEPIPAFKVTVAPDVPPGCYDVRADAKMGVSNSRVFVVGDRPEVAEKEPNNEFDSAQKVEIGTVVNGKFDQGTDVDYYAFVGKAGQRVLVHCASSSIDSKARPLVEIIGPDGRKVTQNRGYDGTDALADLTLATDGNYVVRVSEFTYIGGGPHYFYRLALTTAPWIDAAFPPAIQTGKPAQVTLFGRNLPGGQLDPTTTADGVTLERLTVTMNAPADVAVGGKLSFRGQVEPPQTVLDGFEYRVTGPGGVSNPLLVALSREPVVIENPANNSPETAMKLDGNSEVAARIDARSDRDYFTFAAKKGDMKFIEIIGDRQGANSSFLLGIYPPPPPEPKDPPKDGKKPKRPIMADLSEDSSPDVFAGAQFYARSGDPEPYKFVAPADGDYLIRVTTRESNLIYGPKAAYRLRVAVPKPDFRLVAMAASDLGPDSAQLRAGGRELFDIFCWRLDGFKEPIALAAANLPPGVTAEPGQIIGTNQPHGVFVFAAPAGTAMNSGPVAITGTAQIDGKPIVREARPCSITWPVQQANMPTIARLNQSIFAETREPAPFAVSLDAANAFMKPGEKAGLPLVIKQGEKLTIPAKIQRFGDAKGPVTLQQVAMGSNPQNDPVVANNGQPMPPVAPDKTDANVIIEAKANSPPGTYSFLVTGTMPIQLEDAKKKKVPITPRYPSNPVTVIVLPKEVAKASVTGPAKPIEAGQQGEAVVKVDRQNDYDGPLAVKVVLPANAKGVTVADATIPAGANEVTIVIKTAADAPPANVQNIPVQVTATLLGKYPISVEAKMNVNVVAPPKKK